MPIFGIGSLYSYLPIAAFAMACSSTTITPGQNNGGADAAGGSLTTGGSSSAGGILGTVGGTSGVAGGQTTGGASGVAALKPREARQELLAAKPREAHQELLALKPREACRVRPQEESRAPAVPRAQSPERVQLAAQRRHRPTRSQVDRLQWVAPSLEEDRRWGDLPRLQRVGCLGLVVLRQVVLRQVVLYRWCCNWRSSDGRSSHRRFSGRHDSADGYLGHSRKWNDRSALKLDDFRQLQRGDEHNFYGVSDFGLGLLAE